jgi:hypothetical protein
MIRKLVVAGAAAWLAGGVAWGQTKPDYDEALTAVVDGGCERTETERYIRFFCEEGQAFWYFTHDGTPEHEAYFVAPAYPVLFKPFTVLPPDKQDVPIVSHFGRGRPAGANGREEARERMKAWQVWQREVLEASRKDAENMPPPRRDRGKLYPLEPA